MALVIVTGDPADGSLYTNGHRDENGQVNSNLNFQADARAGTGATLLDDPLGGQVLTIGGGMWNNSATVDRKESFIAFRPAGGLAVPVGIGEVELVNASIRHSKAGKTHSGAPYADDSIRWFVRDWTNVSPSEWMDLNGLQGGTIPEFETKCWIQDGTDNLYEVSGRRMYADVLLKLANKGSLCYVLTMTSACTDYPAKGSTDQGFTAYLPSANTVQRPTYQRPTAILKFVRRHALNHVLGASVQLTDGTAVFLRYDDANEKVNLYYQKVDQMTPTLIAALKTKTAAHDWSSGVLNYYGIEPGNQTFGITRDTFNNIYIAGSRGNEQTNEYDSQFYNIQCFKYTGDGTSHTWIEMLQVTSGWDTSLTTVDVHRGQPNNFAPVWLPRSDASTDGQMVTLHSRRDAQWAKYQMGIQAEGAGWLQGKSGIAQLHGRVWASDGSPTSAWWRPWNASGSGMDAFNDGMTVRFATFSPADISSVDERSTMGVCVVPTSQQPAKITFPPTSISTSSPHDPDAKVRAVWLGDSSPYWGIARHGHILLVDKATDAIYRQIDLSASGIPGFPSRAVLQSSAAWDVIWVNNQDRIAIYYRDQNNVRKIRRVFWDYAANTLSASEDFTVSPIGDSGSDIIAIRLPRQQTDARCILIDVAMQDGGGVPTGLITLRDTSLDTPPLAPTIQAIDQFNAGAPKAIQWIFNDINTGDYATYQDVEIRNLSTGVNAHFVNHTAAVAVDVPSRLYRYTVGASVLTNDTQYQVRIRAYDSVDKVGDWSNWINFATTATGGIVRITEPAADLAPLNKSSVLIKWTYSNTNPSIVQTGYRVRIYNDAAGTLADDSNVVTSVSTERLITGLQSDVIYRVEVTVVDSNGQTSGAGIRLVQPDYNNPSVPEIVVNPQPGYIEVRVTNPPPTGENPATKENQISRKESGADDSQYVVIGTCPPNGVYTDWTVASGVEYTYRARGSS